MITRNLIFGLIILLANACTMVAPTRLYSELTPQVYVLGEPLMSHLMPDLSSPQGVFFKTGQKVKVVGAYQADWLVIRRGGMDYYVERPQSGVTYIAPQYNGYPGGSERAIYQGPRGGQYYINSNGNKTYVTPQSTINERNIQTGPRGGQYYINDNGKKTYIKQ